MDLAFRPGDALFHVERGEFTKMVE
jgi:hypothetical protein